MMRSGRSALDPCQDRSGFARARRWSHCGACAAVLVLLVTACNSKTIAPADPQVARSAASQPMTPLAPPPPLVGRQAITGPWPNVDELVRDYQHGEPPFVVQPHASVV